MRGRSSPNLAYRDKVTLLGGGELTPETLAKLLSRAPVLAACDGAAATALALGHQPDLVIGDMDSIDDATRARLDPATIVELSEQVTTDFDKALRSIRAPLVLGAGFMGRRLDHELACYNALVRHPDRPCILVGAHDICFHAPASLALDLPPQTRVSLFPMTDLVVSASGLVWPLEALALSPMGRVGTSNMSTGPVSIRPSAPGLLVILPVAALDAAVDALETGGSVDG